MTMETVRNSFSGTAMFVAKNARIFYLGLNEIYVWFLLPTYPIF